MREGYNAGDEAYVKTDVEKALGIGAAATTAPSTTQTAAPPTSDTATAAPASTAK